MNPASDLGIFIGRFHPMLVHLPIGLIVILAVLEFISRWPRFSHTNSNAGLVLALTVPITIVTAACGWLLSARGGYDPHLVQWHRWTGVSTATGCAVAALFYLFELRKLYRVFLFGTAAVLVVSSHFGGSLTHGRGYLVQYAPGPLQAVLGLKEKGAPATAARLVATNRLARANQPVFAKLIQPIFEKNCVSCHGPEKSKGSLRLDSLEGLLKGGENGPVITAGKSSESDMIRRLLLPLYSDDHMPPDGKPQPKSEDIALLRWWIDSGASSTATVEQTNPPADLLRTIQSRLGEPDPAAEGPK